MSVHGWLAGSSQPGRGGAEVSLQAGCGERAGSRAAVAAREWAGVPTRARAREAGHVIPFFVILKCCPLSSVRTWGREMAALGSPVSSLVITAVHSSAVNSFLLSHPSSSGGGARPDSSLPAPVRPAALTNAKNS